MDICRSSQTTPRIFTAVVGLLLTLLVGLSTAYPPSLAAQPAWPSVTAENQPWTRWWWMGNSVTEEELTAAMETYQAAGLGGLEITPIYGVGGYEDQFVDYLSPRWMDLLTHVLHEADRLGLGIDLATGTGWPFGGPWVSADDASKYVAYETYTLAGGDRLSEPIQFRQEPFVRAVGTQIYELHGILRPAGETPEGTMEEPLARPGSDEIEIDDLVEPIADNPNLQALALEQVRFPKLLPLQVLMAYAADGRVRNLTDRVDARGQLDWTAPDGDWTLYAVFQGWHGKMVERAAPGGEGYVIDHFAEDPIEDYLAYFDRAFTGYDVSGVRSFFNDSYEVDDARGQANWTPNLFEAFTARRGYDLRGHLPALFGHSTDDENQRVLTDYRATISDLLLDHFTETWRTWAHQNGALVRNQAHGSPANILDLYAASDIPETEGTDVLRIKFASSAANVTGKPLVSSESATWLNEHFRSSLADVKEALDRFFVGGVNHIVYHGTNFSPRDETWPGWLFYAAVHFEPANPFWTDFPALNQYVTRVQSFLQAGRPDNDVLLYFPIHDRYAERGRELLRHFDGGGEGFEDTSFNQGAALMQARGYAFDVISDRQLQEVEAADDLLQTGGHAYQTIVVPASRFMPLETFAHVVALAEAGATVIVHNHLPEDVAGLGDLAARRAAFQELADRLDFTESSVAGVRAAALGSGRFLLGDDLDALLAYAGIRREGLVEEGLQFVRRQHDDGTTYFLTNWSDEAVDGWMPLATEAAAVAVFDPMSGQTGLAEIRSAQAGGVEAYVQLAPGEAWVLQTYDAERTGQTYPYYRRAGAPQVLDGTWSVHFVEGGPERPSDVEATQLRSWTELDGEAAETFSGTATYTLAFPTPDGTADRWLLDLGRVHESARVRLNGHDLGTLIGPTYQVAFDASLLQESNVLEVDVTNLMANRIAGLDREDVPWKKFYNVNFPARLAENRNERGLFDASAWSPLPSGLLGPVTLTPLTSF